MKSLCLVWGCLLALALAQGHASASEALDLDSAEMTWDLVHEEPALAVFRGRAGEADTPTCTAVVRRGLRCVVRCNALPGGTAPVSVSAEEAEVLAVGVLGEVARLARAPELAHYADGRTHWVVEVVPASGGLPHELRIDATTGAVA